MDPFERHIRERAAVEDGVRAGRAVREVERRSRRVSMKPRTPQRPAGSDLAWIKANNRGSMANIGGQLNNSMASRGDNVAKAKAAGTFDRTRETYNTANAAKGYFMNEDGTIAEPGTAPKAPAPPEKPKGPPAAPKAPAPPQAKTPATPAPTAPAPTTPAPATPAPATPAAKAAPKTTPQMQEFFKSQAKQSGQPNKYFDEKGNPIGTPKAAPPATKVAAEPFQTPGPSWQDKSTAALNLAKQSKAITEATNAKWAEKNKPVAKAPEPERVKVDPNMVLKSPGEAEGRATPIETDAQKRAKLAAAAAQEADAKRPGYQKMRQAGGDAIVEVAGAANKAIPQAASTVAEGINTAGKKLTGGLASIGEAIRPFFVGDKTEGPAQKQLRELDKSQAARARGPSFTPLPAGTTPGGYKNATPTQIVKPIEQPKKKLVAAN